MDAQSSMSAVGVQARQTDRPLRHLSETLSLYHLIQLVVSCIALLEVRTEVALAETEPGVLEGPQALTPAVTAPLKGEVETWRARAMAWYMSDDLKSRRRQMREMSRPLKRACYYCHTRGFKGYEEATYLISLQMMAVSAEQGVKCEECHLGRRGLTELGAKSLIQWRYAVDQGLDCTGCHRSGGRFKRLTEKGVASRQKLLPEITKLGDRYHVSREVISRMSHQLSSGLVIDPETTAKPQAPAESPIQTHGSIPPPSGLQRMGEKRGAERVAPETSSQSVRTIEPSSHEEPP